MLRSCCLVLREPARNLPLLRNGFPAMQGVVSPIRMRLYSPTATPPRSPRADLQSIPQAIREILPRSKKRDPSEKKADEPKRRRGPLFYLTIISPLFIWIEVEKYFDPKPLMEKKRRRILRERFETLREKSSQPIQFEDPKAVAAYLRLLIYAMIPDQYLRTLHASDVLSLLDQEFPQDLFVTLQKVCQEIHDISLLSMDEATMTTTAERIQDLADGMLRMAFLAVYPRLPGTTASNPES
ncbi:hypothetical protein B0H10DRAFT_947863 [Mycena sp. CBHHK59/15]|nr:hypothetical protein B0H10DRAFT_947863 [Mycena sp. CBHHK59/15]